MSYLLCKYKPFIFFITCYLLVLLTTPLNSQNKALEKKANRFLKAKNYKAYAKELRLIKNKALKNKDTLTILRAHFLLLQNYQAYTLNADSLKSYYKTGLTLAKKYNNNYYLANYKFIWANSLVVKGNYVTALRIFQALEPIIASNNYDFLPHFYDGYARLLYYLKEPKRAFAYLKKEAFIFKEHQQLKNVSGVYNNLGILYKSQKNKDSALYYHKQSLKISTQLKDTLSIILSYNNIGQTHESLGRQKDALFYYEKSYNIAPEKATESLINNYSKVLIIKKDYNQAVQLLVSILNNSISKRQKKAALEQLVNLYKLTKNYKKALSYQDQLGKVTQSILDETKVKEIERLKIAFESDKKESELLQLKQTAALQKNQIQKNRLLIAIILVVLVLVVIILILYIKTKIATAKANKIKLEQRLMRSQMNPHFMFNALSNIQTDILKENNAKAVKYLVKFSKLLRHNLQNSHLSAIPFTQEITSIKDYLELQNMRLNHILNYNIILDKNIETDLIKVPSMLLQPIVENAIEHGLETTPNPKVTIEVSLENNTLLCKITDNGIGYSNTINKQKSTKKSFATAIIKERLKYLSKKHKQKLQYRIKDAIIKKQIAGTKVLLHLPIIN